MKIITILCVVLSFVLLVYAIHLVFTSHSIREPDGYSTYIVVKGDTLWYIAQSKCTGAQQFDTRDVVTLIREINNCDSNIQAGQILQLPYWN